MMSGIMVREIVMNSVSRLREASSVTQKEIAEAVDVSRQTIIAIEKGNYVPSVLLAMKIAKFFKKSVEEIFRIEHHAK